MENYTEEISTVESKDIVNEERLGVFEHFMDTLNKYGFFKVFVGIIMLVFFSIGTYIAVNPSTVFEKYDAYIEQKHHQSNEYRMESVPIIRNYLNQMVMETGADRAFIIEYHNGKSNPSGLQWQYGDMTFINDNTVDIREEFQNISLVKYPIFYELYEKGLWVGAIEDLEKVDKRFAIRAEVNEVKKCAFVLLYGIDLTELGVLGISFLNEESEFNEELIKKELRKFGTSVSPLLDGKRINAKK